MVTGAIFYTCATQIASDPHEQRNTHRYLAIASDWKNKSSKRPFYSLTGSNMNRPKNTRWITSWMYRR